MDNSMPMGLTRREDTLQIERISNLLVDIVNDTREDSAFRDLLLDANIELMESQKKALGIQEDIKSLIEEGEKLNLSPEALDRVLEEKIAVLASVEEESNELIEKAVTTVQTMAEADEVSEQLAEETRNILKDIQDSQESDRVEEKERRRFSDTDFGKKVASSTDTLTSTLAENLLGPFQLLLKPLEQMFGLDISESLKSGVGSLFNRDEDSEVEKDQTYKLLNRKTTPFRQNLIEMGLIGSTAVYLGDKLDKLFDKKEEIDGPEVQNAVTEAIVRNSGAVMQGFGIASLIGGILWGALDGITAAGKAENWGVSRISAGLAGFLAGKEEEATFMSVFQNAGKFALIGAGAGLLAGGPVGAIAGGLLGTAIGGVLNAIGAQNIALFFDGISDWTGEILGNVKEWLSEKDENISAIKEGILSILSPVTMGITTMVEGVKERVSDFSDIWTGDDTIWVKIKDSLSTFLLGLVEIPLNLFKGQFIGLMGDRWSTISDLLGDEEPTAWFKIKEVSSQTFFGILDYSIGGIKSLLSIGDNIILSFLSEQQQEAWEGFKESFVDYGVMLKTSIGNLIDTIVVKPVDHVVSWAREFSFSSAFDSVKDSITGFFTSLGDTIRAWIIGRVPNWLRTPRQREFLASYDRSDEFDLDPFDESLYELPDTENLDEEGKVKLTTRFVNWITQSDKKTVNPYKVNDGVIYKDGQIIHTHEDDNIIATKADPIIYENREVRELQREVERSYFSEKDNKESLGKFDQMIDLLQVVANTIADNGNTIINNTEVPQTFNFDSLRLGGIHV